MAVAMLRPGSAGYEAILRPGEVRPRLVIRCHSAEDVVAAVGYAKEAGERLVPRGGGHCFAGRSSTDGTLLDLSGLDGIAAGGIATDRITRTCTIGAGARLGQIYAALHEHGLTLPAGCGPTVGIAGLTLGGGIGLLGRGYGLTCDRLVGAQVVLADGSIVECDHDREPHLFWALRGAGGGQFGVVTALRFATVPEPMTCQIEAQFRDISAIVGSWQASAPDAPDELTVNLTLEADPGEPIRATLFGASTLDQKSTRDLLGELTGPAGKAGEPMVTTPMPFHLLKEVVADPGRRQQRPPDGAPTTRIRSELFRKALSDQALTALLAQLSEPRQTGRRQLTFTAMGGAYNRVPEDATAFAHRSERFLLEHIADPADPWVDDSWTTAHADASGRVYPNFPDPALEDWRTAYHAGNYPRLVAVKRAYDPDRLFDLPQGVR
jgi:FAD/FMN-containing dehydrogenase